MKKVKKTTIIILILLTGLIILGGYLVYTDVISPAIEERSSQYFNGGSLYGSEQIILKINQEGTIPVIKQDGNQTSIQWIPLAQVCNA